LVCHTEGEHRLKGLQLRRDVFTARYERSQTQFRLISIDTADIADVLALEQGTKDEMSALKQLSVVLAFLVTARGLRKQQGTAAA